MTLYGLITDNEQTMTLEPKDAFGLRDENNNEYSRFGTFPDTEMVKVGNIIEIDVKEKDGKVSSAFAMIKQVSKDSVLLDLNHPLAGHKIIFKVKIINIDG